MEPCQNLIEFRDEAKAEQERKVLFMTQKESSMEAVQNLFSLRLERTSVVPDQHFCESVIELAVSCECYHSSSAGDCLRSFRGH